MAGSHIIDGMNVAGVQVPAPQERTLKVVLSPELGNVDKFTLLFSIISPKSTTGIHTHNSDEVMCVATGRGEGVVGDEKAQLREDTVILAPKLVRHCVTNTGEETLKLVCFFIPSLEPTAYFGEAIKRAKEYYKSIYYRAER